MAEAEEFALNAPVPVSAEKSATLCDLGVFVEETAKPVVADDCRVGVDRFWQRPQWAGLFQGSMGAGEY